MGASFFFFIMRTIVPYRLTYAQLLKDLHTAYIDARRHKRNKSYQLRFEANLEHNLSELCHELWTRRYRPQPSTCFIITDPKRREVFAAEFRDRVVHHLYYNYVHTMLERTFIQDSYSCIRKRGTHYGIRRLEQHIRQESQNYMVPCYVMKMDIRGYFMHINREKLLDVCLSSLLKMAGHRVNHLSVTTWQELVDMDFVSYLTREIVLLNPVEDCRVRGTYADWRDLPHDKSLFHSGEGCGLPIGNLTSQLFSNVYLNVFDQYMKRILHCRHYGRYVDDFFVVSADRGWLHSLVEPVRVFLADALGLSLHEGKLHIVSVRQGVEFLGAFLKPHRNYVSNATLCRMQPKIEKLSLINDVVRRHNMFCSFCGILGHYASYHLRGCILNYPYLFC